MNFFRAFKIFRFLLKADEWYVIAGNDDFHFIDASIQVGKLQHQVNSSINDAIQSEILLEEAKNILK